MTLRIRRLTVAVTVAVVGLFGQVGEARAGWTSWMDEWPDIRTDRQQRPAVVSLAPGRLDVMWLDGFNTLRHRTFNNGWSKARVVPAPAFVPAFEGGLGCGTWSAPSIVCFARAGSGRLWQLTFDGAGWRFDQLAVLNVASDVSVVSWGFAHLDLMWIDPAGNLVQKSFNQAAGGWLGNVNLGSAGGGFVGSPGCASWAPGRTDCFMRGRDHRLWQKYAVGAWQPGFHQLFGAVITGSPTVASWAPNHLDVMFPGQDGDGNPVIWTAWWVGSWGLGALSSDFYSRPGFVPTSRSEPACVSWSANRIDCFLVPDVDGERSIRHNLFTTWVNGLEMRPEPLAGPLDPREFSLLNKFAPRLKFHPKEQFLPTTVEDALATAALKFRRKSGAVEELVPRGQLTPIKLGERRLAGINGPTTPQQPSDRVSHDSETYYFVDLDASTHPGTSWRRFPDWRDRLRIYGHADRIIKDGVAVGFELQYYVLFANDGGSPDVSFDDPYRHEGDWEVFKVETDLAGNFQRAVYYGHGHTTHDSTQVALLWADSFGREIEFGPIDAFTHPVVFVSLSKHALYATDASPAERDTIGADFRAGRHDSKLGGLIDDYTSSRGVSWDSVHKVEPLASPFAPGNPLWTRFMGRWGETHRAVLWDGIVASPEGPSAKGTFCQTLMEGGTTLERCLPRCSVTDRWTDSNWVVMYRDAGFQGPYEIHRLVDFEGDFHNLSANMNFNRQVSSIRWCLAPQVQYTLYERVWYGGASITLRNSGACTRLDDCPSIARGWNDRISSSSFQ